MHEIIAGHRSLSGTIACVTDKIRFLPVIMTGRFSHFNSVISYTEDRHELRVTGTKWRLPNTMSGIGEIFISGAAKYPNLDQNICVALKAITIHIYTLFRLNHVFFVARENNIVSENTNLDQKICVALKVITIIIYTFQTQTHIVYCKRIENIQLISKLRPKYICRPKSHYQPYTLLDQITYFFVREIDIVTKHTFWDQKIYVTLKTITNYIHFLDSTRYCLL